MLRQILSCFNSINEINKSLPVHIHEDFESVPEDFDAFWLKTADFKEKISRIFMVMKFWNLNLTISLQFTVFEQNRCLYELIIYIYELICPSVYLYACV